MGIKETTIARLNQSSQMAANAARRGDLNKVHVQITIHSTGLCWAGTDQDEQTAREFAMFMTEFVEQPIMVVSLKDLISLIEAGLIKPVENLI